MIMAYSYFRSNRFKKEYQKSDGHMQKLAAKKMAKIISQPELGKPLRAPLAEF